MAIYLPEFDKPLHVPGGDRPISLREQLVFSALTEGLILISAASPFKNHSGWREIHRYRSLLYEGIMKFPLDEKHGGRIDHYVHSRATKIALSIEDYNRNPEYAGYTGREAEPVLNLVNNSDFVTPRLIDCDAAFRRLVIEDALSDEPGTLKNLLLSKRLGFGKEEFLAYVVETAQDWRLLFQRFTIVDHAPDAFVIDGVLRERLYARLDKLFYRANALSAGLTGNDADAGFTGTLAHRLRAFASAYCQGGFSLREGLLALDPASLVAVKRSDEMKAFLQQFRSWLQGTVREYIEIKARGHRWATKDRHIPSVNRVLASAISASLAEVVGWLLSSALSVPFGMQGAVASFVVGLLPGLTISLKRTSAHDLLRLVAGHPRMQEVDRCIAGVERNSQPY